MRIDIVAADADKGYSCPEKHVPKPWTGTAFSVAVPVFQQLYGIMAGSAAVMDAGQLLIRQILHH